MKNLTPEEVQVSATPMLGKATSTLPANDDVIEVDDESPQAIDFPQPLSIDAIASLTGKKKWQIELDNFVQKEFNKDFAVVLNGTKAVVMKTMLDTLEENDTPRKLRVYLPTQSFHALYANTSIQNNEKEVSKDKFEPVYATKSQAWFKHEYRQQYLDGIVFIPYQYVNGIEKRPHITCQKLNLWDGYSVKPIKGVSGELDRILYHIKHIICRDDEACYEYILNWIASCLQYPDRNGQVATVLKGKKGCGKSTLGHLLLIIFGQHGLQIANPKYLVGNFNAHLADCAFLFADEAFFAGDKQHENIQKALITESKMIVEKKGVDAEVVKNRLKILMASNAEWVVPTSEDERRYFVLDVSSEQIGKVEYFKPLRADIVNPAIQSAFLFAMLHRDISNFDVSKYPDTKASQYQRLQSLDSFGHYWHDVLQRGYVYESQHGNDLLRDWSYEVASELIMRGYTQWFNRNKIGQFGIVPREKVGRYLTSWYGDKKRKLNAIGFLVGETAKGEMDVSMKQTFVFHVGTHAEAIVSFCNAEKLDSTPLLKSVNLHAY